VAAAAVLVLLLLFLLRPGASRLKSRIIFSISAGVGRSVDIGSVHLRLLPRPGFDLENLVVYDDPEFGAEPMLRASEVTADLRLLSLLRGRMEIARLDLTEPSLNLVHGENGRWNVEGLLERTAHTPLAPTGKAKSEPRPGFPYIAATSARINFKDGPEKKPYALTNADFSLWQDSENSWGVRLKAQPFRTDLNLNDTGGLVVNGTWQRADSLRDTPLQFSVEWSRAQLGQVTKFFTGNDMGWRGGVQLDVTLTGTPAELQLVSDASVQDFRRYDITSGQPLRLAGHCLGQYSSIDHGFHELDCSTPVGSGMITLKGDMGPPGSHHYGLTVSAKNIPASAAVMLAQRAKKDLPEDLVAEGSVSGNFWLKENASEGVRFRLQGRGAVGDLRLASAANNAEVGAETIPFVLTSGEASGERASGQGLRESSAMRVGDGTLLEFGPFPVAMGRGNGPTVQAWVSRGGYDVSVAGDSDIAKGLRVARLFGVPALQTTTEGTAQVDLRAKGSWAGRSNGSGFAAPQVTGTAKLKNVRIGFRGAGGPVEIVSAMLQLLPSEARLDKLSAKAAGTSWNGSLEMPRGCGTPGACQVHFNLRAKQIAWSELSAFVNPRPKERPWYRVLESSTPAGSPFLANLRAEGRVTADKLQVQNLAPTRVSANVKLERGKMEISALNADFLGGEQRGEWDADFGAKIAVCHGSGTLTGVSLAQLADTMKDDWIEGTGDGTYEVKGTCAGGFWGSAEGTLAFDVRDGSLPHVSLAEGAYGLQIEQLAGHARLHGGTLEIKDAKMDSPEGKFDVSGIASLKREVDFKLVRSSSGTTGYTITGTLAEPKVVPLAGGETQARLKGEPAK
jgi:hypothetical protein